MSDTPIVNGLELNDPRTHVERIDALDGLGADTPPAPAPAAEAPTDTDPAPTEFAHEDHPKGERWPYLATEKAFINDMLVKTRQIMWLLPHEVARYHVFAKEALPRPEAAASDTQV